MVFDRFSGWISYYIPITGFTTKDLWRREKKKLYTLMDNLRATLGTTPHVYLLNSACFWEEIVLDAPGATFFASYSLSFCFNCKIFIDVKKEKRKITVRNEPQMIERVQIHWLWLFHITSCCCLSHITAYWPMWLSRLTTLLLSWKAKAQGKKKNQLYSEIFLVHLLTRIIAVISQLTTTWWL